MREDHEYIDKSGYSYKHSKCGNRMLYRTRLGNVPFCENCQCFVTKPEDYIRYKEEDNN